MSEDLNFVQRARREKLDALVAVGVAPFAYSYRRTHLAADAVSGRALCGFPTNHNWKASPMTYMFDGTEYIAVVAGGNVMAFAVR